MRLPLILAIALLVFVPLGLLTENRLSASAREMTRVLAKIERELEQGRHESALTELRRFKRHWSRVEGFWALLTDHHEMDQVHLAIDRADRFLAARSLPEARAELASLRFLVGHIPKKESLSLRTAL